MDWNTDGIRLISSFNRKYFTEVNTLLANYHSKSYSFSELNERVINLLQSDNNFNKEYLDLVQSKEDSYGFVSLIISTILSMAGKGAKSEGERYKSLQEYDIAHEYDNEDTKEAIEKNKKAKTEFIKKQEIKAKKTQNSIIIGFISLVVIISITGVLIYKNKI